MITLHIRFKSYRDDDRSKPKVGYARPQYVQELALQDYRECMDVNYYGQLNPILVLLLHLMNARKGHIVNVSSTMGYFGIMGYAAYAPTKFAMVGLTEVLRHELKPYNICMSIFHPSDTDTPGYQEENRTKPVECAQISSSVKLLGAHQAAQDLLDGIIRKKYMILTRGSGLMWSVNRHLPWLVRCITDMQYKQARKKLGKQP